MATRHGDTLLFSQPPVISAWAAVGGKKEGEGPLAPALMSCARTTVLASPAGKQRRNTCSCGLHGSACKKER